MAWKIGYEVRTGLEWEDGPMERQGPAPAWQVLAVFLVVLLIGLGARLLMVALSPDEHAGMGVCQTYTDFWNGDLILC